MFETLWPLTERRSSRRRWEISDGGLTWTVEELAGSGPWAVEVRLPPHAADAPLPEWLAPLVMREVTGDERAARSSPAATS